MIFLKRESLLKKTAEEAKPRYVGEHIRGETFRQKGLRKGLRSESCVEEKGYLRRTVKTKDRKAMHTQYWCCIVFLILPDSWEEGHNTYFIYVRNQKWKADKK